MAISDKEFYAAHGIDYNPAKWLQGYTDYALIKMLEDVKNEIELESHDQQYCPYPKDIRYKCPGCHKIIEEGDIGCTDCEVFFDWSRKAKIQTIKKIVWE